MWGEARGNAEKRPATLEKFNRKYVCVLYCSICVLYCSILCSLLFILYALLFCNIVTTLCYCFFFCVLYCSLFLYCTVSACDIRAATLTEAFPCLFLCCKANARV
jgi:hypothetical protein